MSVLASHFVLRRVLIIGVLGACSWIPPASAQMIGTPHPPANPGEPQTLSDRLPAVIGYLERGLGTEGAPNVASRFAMPISVMNSTPGVQTVYEAYNFRTTDGYRITSINLVDDGQNKLITTTAIVSDKPCLSVDTAKQLYPQGKTAMTSVLSAGAPDDTPLMYYTRATNGASISFGYQRLGFRNGGDTCITSLTVSSVRNEK